MQHITERSQRLIRTIRTKMQCFITNQVLDSAHNHNDSSMAALGGVAQYSKVR
jgi:hypothetical protein